MHNILCPAKTKIRRSRPDPCCTAQRQVFHAVSIFCASKKLSKLRRRAEISGLLDLQAIVNNSGLPTRFGERFKTRDPRETIAENRELSALKVTAGAVAAGAQSSSSSLGSGNQNDSTRPRR
jgi:hypothetical protein